MNTYTILDNPTLYPSTYMVVSNNGYTKHYCAGAERACATISIQLIQYLPFGENYVSNHTASPYTERFAFTGKEKDEETGYTYHGARYYDASLMCSWFSVDPLSDKYPSLSPYNYCMWNPIKIIDPDGRDTVRILLNRGTFSISEGGSFYAELYIGDKVFGMDLKDGFELQDSWDGVAEGSNFVTRTLKFSNLEDGKKVFDRISSLASNGKTRAEIEWDYYGLNDGTGDLVNSNCIDKVITNPNQYGDEVISWDHYHPISSDGLSWRPSDSDNKKIRYYKSIGVPCTLHTGGEYYRMDLVYPFNGTRDSELEKVQGRNPRIKSFML